MNWSGPHGIGDYLASVARSQWKRPPETPGVYLIAERAWRNLPAKADMILYVGRAASLRYQIGRMMCDLLGFTGDDSSSEEFFQHRGGHALWAHYCLPRQIEPTRLYLGWCSECFCADCAEAKLLELITTGPRPVRTCASHRPVLELQQNTTSVIVPEQKNSNGRLYQ